MIEKRKNVESRTERQIITGMITSTRFLTGIHSLWKKGCLSESYTTIIGEWCIEYFKKYEEAPGKNISDIFQNTIKTLSDEQSDLIGELLAELSEEFEKSEKENQLFNVDFALDKAEMYFRTRSLEEVSKELKHYIASGHIEEAENVISGYSRIVREESEGVDLITDEEVIKRAFEEKESDVLLRLPGELGMKIGGVERGHLLAVLAQSGVGKTWWLMEMGLLCLFRGMKVVFASFEMSESDMTRRIHQRMTGRPLRKKVYHEEHTREEKARVLIPVFDCKKNQRDGCSLKWRRRNAEGKFEGMGKKPSVFDDISETYRTCDVCRSSEKREIRREYEMETWFKEVHREYLSLEIASKKSLILQETVPAIRKLKAHKNFRFVEYPSMSLSMKDFKTRLKNWEFYDGFVPDVIITDYADKFAVSQSYYNQPYRLQLKDIWDGHKSLAQEYHALVITASQSNTTRSGEDISQSSWAESIAKQELIDLGISLYQKKGDVAQGIMRVAVVKQRHEFFNSEISVTVLYNYDIGRAYLDSCIR